MYEDVVSGDDDVMWMLRGDKFNWRAVLQSLVACGGWAPLFIDDFENTMDSLKKL